MKDWDPELYNRFSLYRAEPFHAILERLRIGPDERIVDLGCGSGENTVELARRAAQGVALGIDSSPAMIAQAEQLRSSLPPELRARLEFKLGDITTFTAPDQYSLVFSNAALHWVADHGSALARCYRLLQPGGKLVVQMPANEQETAQVTLTRLAAEAPWRAMLAGVQPPSHTVGSPQYYAQMLGQLGFVEIDCYYQVFAHPMNGPGEVVEWCRATTLRPFLETLPRAHHGAFIAQFVSRLETAYGTRGPLTFNFRRIFLWARRKGA